MSKEIEYPKSVNETGNCIPLTKEENEVLGLNLSKLSIADLLAYRDYCFERQDYFQRRIPKNVKKGEANWHLYELHYSWWVWWFHITEYVRFTIDKKTSDLITPPQTTGNK